MLSQAALVRNDRHPPMFRFTIRDVLWLGAELIPGRAARLAAGQREERHGISASRRA